MDEHEAAALVEAEIERLRASSYQQLRRMGTHVRHVRGGSTQTLYNVEIQTLSTIDDSATFASW